MCQRVSSYFSLIVFVVVIYLCSLNEVNCDEDNLEFRRAENEIHNSESAENSEDDDVNLVYRQKFSTKPTLYFWDNRIKRPSTSQSNLNKNKSKVLLDTLISDIRNNIKNNSVDWLNLVLKRLDSNQRYPRRRKRNYKSWESESSESEVETDTETEKKKEKDKETDDNSEAVLKKVIERIGEAHKEKSTTKESGYTTDTQEETVKVKHNTRAERDKIKYGKDKYVVEVLEKRETRKTTESDTMKTLGKNKESTMQTQETAEQLKAPKEMENEHESTIKIRLEKNIMRQKQDLDNKDKKHLSTKRHHYDHSRENKKKSQQLKDKETIKQEMKNKEKKKTHKLKNEHTTINSYSSEEEETKAQTRHPKKPRFTAAYNEGSGNSTQTALRQYSEKTNVRQDGKLDEPNMDSLNPYSLKKQLQKIVCELQDTNVTLTTIGRTAEYNDVILLQATELRHDILRTDKMSSKYEDDPPEKKIIFIVHGLNIWGFTELPYLFEMNNFLSLLKNYLEHLDKFDIYLIPMANPDGLAFSMHHHIWNKNVSPQDACPGVMLDRNFDIAWNEGPQLSSCSQYYAGNHAFSEYETQAIREVFHRLSHKIVGYIHVHAGGLNEHVFKVMLLKHQILEISIDYPWPEEALVLNALECFSTDSDSDTVGDAVLYPKGFTATTGDDDKYVDLKGEIDEAMRNASFKVMSVTVDSLYNWYGKVTGTSVDYASTIYGIPYAFDFAMQVYDSNTEEDFFDAAQNEIWHRLIDVIFRYIYKTTVKTESASEVRKLKKI